MMCRISILRLINSLDLNAEQLLLYIGSNPANDNTSFVEDNSLPSFSRAVNQRDADLVYFWQKVCGYIIKQLDLDLLSQDRSLRKTMPGTN